MTKDWRLAVCTRWRPEVTLLLICLSLLCTGTAIFIITMTVDEYPVRRLERRIHSVKAGMSVAELESILGPPVSTTNEFDRKNLNLREGGSDNIVEYRYSAENRLRDSITEYEGIFVDEATGRVVSVHLSAREGGGIDFTFWEEWALLIAIGLLVLVVLVVMLFFEAWCQSVTDASESQER